MKKILIAIIILGIFTGAFLLNKAFAAGKKRLVIATENAVVLFLSGDVRVKGPALADWADAAAGMVLSKGDSIKTGVDSWVEIGFGKNLSNVIRIKENTLVELTELGPVKIGLLKGEVRSLVEKLANDTTFEIKTPTAVCGARGTGWDTNTDGRKVIVDAYEDEVFFYGLAKDGTPIMDDPIIEAGKRGVLEEPAGPISIKDLPIERMRDWNRWKEDFFERRGIEGRLTEKVGKTQQTQKTMEDMIKGKEGAFEKGQQDKMDERLKTIKESTSGGGE